MKLKISIFILPQEIDLFEYIMIQLKRNSIYLNSLEVIIDATLCTSPKLTNWNASTLTPEYFVKKLHSLSKYADWCTYIPSVEHGNSILGCVSKRRESIKDNTVDAHMWLDCDMIFSDYTFYYIEAALQTLQNAGHKYYILTPEIMKIWDNTWDSITNKLYIEKPLKYHLTADVFKETSTAIDSDAERTVEAIEQFKFAGGWLTILSAPLAELVQIPDSLGHYGLEDFFVMEACNILRSVIPVSQFVLKNVLVAENHKYRDDSYITDLIRVHDVKDEYRNIAWSHITEELNKYNKDVRDGKIVIRST